VKYANTLKSLVIALAYAIVAATPGLPAVAATSPPPSIPARTWLLVDTVSEAISVYRGERRVAYFPNISIGRAGTTLNRSEGDEATPLGRYHVAYIIHHTPFHIFFGLDYPSARDAHRALREGLISGDTYHAIMVAVDDHRLPPQNTPLGGAIGIHGIGDGSVEIHNHFNWTKGCIALTNRQIDRLSRFISVGTTVYIR